MFCTKNKIAPFSRKLQNMEERVRERERERGSLRIVLYCIVLYIVQEYHVSKNVYKNEICLHVSVFI
jgi:hypothetical protein